MMMRDACGLWKRDIQAIIPNCEVPVPSGTSWHFYICFVWPLLECCSLESQLSMSMGNCRKEQKGLPWLDGSQISSTGSSLLHKPGLAVRASLEKLEDGSALEAPNFSRSSKVVRPDDSRRCFWLSACLVPFPAFPVGIGCWEEADSWSSGLCLSLGTRDLSCSLDTGSNDATQEGRQGEGKEISFFLWTRELYQCLEICQDQWNNLGNCWKIFCGGSAVLWALSSGRDETRIFSGASL